MRTRALTARARWRWRSPGESIPNPGSDAHRSRTPPLAAGARCNAANAPPNCPAADADRRPRAAGRADSTGMVSEEPSAEGPPLRRPPRRAARARDGTREANTVGVTDTMGAPGARPAERGGGGHGPSERCASRRSGDATAHERSAGHQGARARPGTPWSRTTDHGVMARCRRVRGRAPSPRCRPAMTSSGACSGSDAVGPPGCRAACGGPPRSR